MKRSAGPILALLLVALPAAAWAQGGVYFGGGATIPVGEFKDYAKTGWMGQAGGFASVGSNGMFIGGEGFYGSNNHEGSTGGSSDKTNLYGADAMVGYRFGDPAKAGPYVSGLVGLMVHKYAPATGTGDSSTGILFGGTVGVDIPAGKVNLWVEGRWMNGRFSEDGESSNTGLFGLFAGVTVPVGGS